MPRKLLILGGSGFIGRNLRDYFANCGCMYTVSAPSHDTCDLLDAVSIEAVMAEYKPSVVINAAGFKDQAKAAEHGSLCLVNEIGADNLGEACKHHGVPLIHISSDHVLSEPDGNYARSKRAGEMLLDKEHATVLRTGHVYGPHCPWIQWLDRELTAGHQVEAWTDIRCRPTYVRDLAAVIEHYIRVGPSGVVTFVGPWELSRFDLFRAYAHVFDHDKKLIVPVKDKAPAYYPRQIRYVNYAPPVIEAMDVDLGFRDMKMRGEK